MKGGKYKDHYKTLLNWHKRGFLNNGGKPKLPPVKPVQKYDEAEELRQFNEQWNRNIQEVNGH